jgi:hypothetical protein
MVEVLLLDYIVTTVTRVVGLFTGHYHLKGHLFKLGLTDDLTCERWNQPHTYYVIVRP